MSLQLADVLPPQPTRGDPARLYCVDCETITADWTRCRQCDQLLCTSCAPANQCHSCRAIFEIDIDPKRCNDS